MSTNFSSGTINVHLITNKKSNNGYSFIIETEKLENGLDTIEMDDGSRDTSSPRVNYYLPRNLASCTEAIIQGTLIAKQTKKLTRVSRISKNLTLQEILQYLQNIETYSVMYQ